MGTIVTEYIAPKYAERFRCIGADCEDNCCTGWEVAVDEEHYQTLGHRMAQESDEERREFQRNLARNDAPNAGRAKYALIVLTESSQCSFLGTDRLCSLHKRYGSHLLPDTCAIYPRQVGLVGTRVELTARVSCPEVTRKLLLAADALELVNIPAEALERTAVNRYLKADPLDGYGSALDQVRMTVLRMLNDRTFPFSSRLAAVGCLSEELTSYFHLGAPRIDQTRLLDDCLRFSDTGSQQAIHEQFQALEVPAGFAASIVLRVLASRMHRDAGSLGQLVLSIFRHTGCEKAGSTQVEPEEVLRVLESYQKTKEHCERVFGSRLDTYFANYAMNYFLQEWYTISPDLAAHAKKLLLRLATVRFLLFCHPRIAAAPDALDTDTLDRVAVEVFYKFSRGVEHSPKFLDVIEKDFLERAPTLAQAMFLAKF